MYIQAVITAIHLKIYHSKKMSYHVCKWDIEEHSTSNGKDSIWSKTTAQQDPQCKTEITAHRWQQIKTRSLTNTHARVQQNHKISYRETERKSDFV